jgi:hypothetical protein
MSRVKLNSKSQPSASMSPKDCSLRNERARLFRSLDNSRQPVCWPLHCETPNGRRQYHEPDVRRLTFVRHARELGFELSDVRMLLHLADNPAEPCAEFGAIARHHLDSVEDRIVLLNPLRKELARITRACAGDKAVDQCNIIEALDRSARCPPVQERKRTPSEPSASSDDTRCNVVQQGATWGKCLRSPASLLLMR